MVIFLRKVTLFFILREYIYEIRMAFKAGIIPNWVNFNTFHFAGQAISGMYPDITLWPLVMVTNFFSPIDQIIAIRALITLLTFTVTVLTLRRDFGYRDAVYVATIFTLSGFTLYVLVNEFQPGTAIINIFLFPLINVFRNLLNTKRISLKLSIQSSLLFTIIMFSHLTSAIILMILVGLLLIYRVFFQHILFSILNMGLACILSILTTCPILYRYFIISSSKLNPPFGQGQIMSIDFMDYFIKSVWNGRNCLTVVSMALICLTIFKLTQKNIKKISSLLIMESMLLILGSNYFPWSIFDNVPIINLFQNTAWRFGIFVNAIPLLMFLIIFPVKFRKGILLCFALFSISATMSVIKSSMLSMEHTPMVTEKTKRLIPDNVWFRATSTGMLSNSIERTVIPDYTPDGIKIAPNTNGNYISRSNAQIIQNHLAFWKDGSKKYYKKMLVINHSINQISFSGSIKKDGEITLPIYGYSSLHYKTYVNNVRVKNFSNKQGYLSVRDNTKTDGHKIYRIVYAPPYIYKILLIFSFSLLVGMILCQGRF